MKRPGPAMAGPGRQSNDCRGYQFVGAMSAPLGGDIEAEADANDGLMPSSVLISSTLACTVRPLSAAVVASPSAAAAVASVQVAFTASRSVLAASKFSL